MQEKEISRQWIFLWRARNFKINFSDRYDSSCKYSLIILSKCHVSSLQCSSRHMVGRHPFLGTCATYFEALPFASHVLKVSEKEKSTIHEVYAKPRKRNQQPPGFTQFRCNKFPSTSRILRNRKRARFGVEKKRKKDEYSITQIGKEERSQFYTFYELKKRPFHIHRLCARLKLLFFLVTPISVTYSCHRYR